MWLYHHRDDPPTEAEIQRSQQERDAIYERAMEIDKQDALLREAEMAAARAASVDDASTSAASEQEVGNDGNASARDCIDCMQLPGMPSPLSFFILPLHILSRSFSLFEIPRFALVLLPNWIFGISFVYAHGKHAMQASGSGETFQVGVFDPTADSSKSN